MAKGDNSKAESLEKTLFNYEKTSFKAADKENNEKAVRLVEYLYRMSLLHAKLVRNIAEYEKVLWISSVPHEQGCFTQAWGRDEEHESDEWLEIQNRREPELPAVPEPCKKWINPPSLRNKNEKPTLLSEITIEIKNPDNRKGSKEPECISQVEKIEAHPEIQRAWDRYLESKWLPWVEEHNIWEKIHKVYSVLFSMYQDQIRLGEEYELVLGLGLLTWQTPTSQRVRRHLLVADAQIVFEAKHQRFTVKPHPDGTKLRPELDMLDIEDQPTKAEELAKAGLFVPEDNPQKQQKQQLVPLEDPWEKSVIEDVLKGLAHSLSSENVKGDTAHGEYHDRFEKLGVTSSPKPIVEFAPALILRKRSSKGLTEILKRIQGRIEKGEDIPREFADLAEIAPQNYHDSDKSLEELQIEFAGEIFFPKPSNDEQRRIVEKIRTSSGVLVQGPPGTGKSHTIANLICHLLATGQRILITAKTPRALQVLEGLVPSELHPLCINMLGSGMEERQSLESSVGGILRKNDEWNEENARKECNRLEQHIRKLREEKVVVHRQLRDIRESETHSHSITEGIYQGTAAQIAKAVNRDRMHYDWFQDTVPLDKTFKIDELGMRCLLAALRDFPPDKIHESNLAWPEDLPSLEELRVLFEEERKASEENSSLNDGDMEPLADLLSKGNAETIQNIYKMLNELRGLIRQLQATKYAWISQAVQDVMRGNSSPWRGRYDVTSEEISKIEMLVSSADDVSIEFPPTFHIRAIYEDACKLRDHMALGGKLGWGPFRSKTVKECLGVIKKVCVNGRLCSTADHFSILCNALQVRLVCDKLWEVWTQWFERTNGPYAIQLQTLKSLRNTLGNILSFGSLVDKCRESLRQFSSVAEPEWENPSQIENYIEACRLAVVINAKCSAEKEIHNIENQCHAISSRDDTHPIVSDLVKSIRNRDIGKYTCFYTKIQEFKNARHRIKEMKKDLNNLIPLYPRLMEDMRRTFAEPTWDVRLPQIRKAWHWAQARYWIEEYIRKEDVPALSIRAKQIEDEIHACIANLASLYAWSFCFSRLKEEHRRHMEAWQQSMRRLGKGTGKHAPRHRREAQQHLNQCREAVPAWIMPLHRIWDTVDPAPGMFDLIIVDEASQCGLEGLPLFYLGKKILIVGDDKQISPEVGFIEKNIVFQLMEKYLYDFSHKDSFHRDASLFDHGKLRYGTSRITLREHFRCMPEIIRFSNDLCYSDTPLIPLRQYGPNRLTPLDHIFVPGGYREGTNNRIINRPEAEAVVKKVVELCEDRRYDGKTIGIVVLQGEAQAALIENQLLELLGAGEMEKRRLICGNPYSFQGDERDIMLLSLVAASNERIGPLTKAADERRFNVAASRARDMMILFHSVSCDDLSDICLRRRLLDFFENTQPQQIAGINREDLELRAKQDNRSVVRPPSPFDSWFEIDVALELLRKGFAVLAQHEIAGKRIDLVVEGGQARLAVECDGDNWHGIDHYEADMQRQRQLERCGWEFFRVKESAFYSNREESLKGLWQALKDRDIHPNESSIKNEEESTNAKINSATLNNDDANIRQKSDQNKVITNSAIKVQIGSTVTYVNEDDGQSYQAMITSGPSNPEWGEINVDTPIAKAILGAEVGQLVEVRLPVGLTKLMIVEIQ